MLQIKPDPTLAQEYKNDYKRARSISQILYQLDTSKNGYPSSITNLFANDIYDKPKPSVLDPITGQAYDYKSIDNGKDFNLTVNFETNQAVSSIGSRSFYYGKYTATSTTYSGKTVTFSKGSYPSLTMPEELPKPALVSLQENAQYLPAEFSISLSAGATADWNTSDWTFNTDATGDFGDLTYKVNIDALRKDKDYYIKINNLPSLFFLSDLSSYKGKWIKLDTSTSTTEYTGDTISYVGNNISKLEDGYKKDRSDALDFLRILAKVADDEKVFDINGPIEEKSTGTVLYKYELIPRKEAILTFYEKLLEATKDNDFAKNSSLFTDQGLVEYLKSPEFSEVFDYVKANTHLTLWVDDKGFPAKVEYSMRVTPPDTAINLKDKQANLVLTLSLENINNSVNIKAPSDSTNAKDITSAASANQEVQDIKARLAGVRAEAEIFYDQNTGYNGAAGNVAGSCTTKNSMFTDPNISYELSPTSLPAKTKLSCYSSQKAYAVSASLPTPENGYTYWCIDSIGSSVGTKSPAKTTSCP